MGINIECACGKKLVFGDVHEGKRGLCPACNCPVDIRHPEAIHDVGDILPSKAIDPLPWHRHPVVIIAAAVAGLAGLTLLMAKTHQVKPTPLPELDIVAKVAREQPSFAYVENPTPDQIRQWVPYAKYCAEYSFDGMFREDHDVESFRIYDTVAEQSPPDPRKVSWLWVAKMRADVTYKNKRPKEDSRHYLYDIKTVFRFVPPDNVVIYWNEMTDTLGKVDHSRRHMTWASEWRPDFRKAVLSAWDRADGRKSHVAQWMNLSQSEVQEIVDFKP